MSDYVLIKEKAWKLINYVAVKYEVKSYEEFTCPFHKALAEELEYFADI